MAKRSKVLLLLLGAGVCLVSGAYGLRTTVQQVQTAQPDAEMTRAFIEIVPPGVVPDAGAFPVSTATAVPSATPLPAVTQFAAGLPINLNPRAESREMKRASAAAAEESLFDTLVVPFVNEARKRRAENAKADPAYLKRIDRELNEGRVNFLLFGYGETHEPPLTEKALIGSQTILSYDLRTRKIDVVSFTHDIRAPEIEREIAKRGYQSPPVRIDQAYAVGGFKLMRQVMEDATGLAIDFQVTFRDAVMQGLVDNVFQGVEVNVPMTFDVHPFYLDGKKYDKGHFGQGRQKLNGRQVIQFIKTVPVAEGLYDKALEHNARKSLVFDALLASVSKTCTDRGFWLRGSAFVAGEMIGGSIVYDFDPLALIVNNIGNTTASLQRTMSSDCAGERRLPKINRSRYIVDAAHGDGGVQWVNANAAENPITKRDIENGVYPSLDLEIPITANPYGDLPTEYWTSVRTLVKFSLTAQEPAYNLYTE